MEVNGEKYYLIRQSPSGFEYTEIIEVERG
jgi:DNA sulfur modification protein DndD